MLREVVGGEEAGVRQLGGWRLLTLRHLFMCGDGRGRVGEAVQRCRVQPETPILSPTHRGLGLGGVRGAGGVGKWLFPKVLGGEEGGEAG